MNNKNYFIFAAAIALASCSVDEYVGENPEFTQTTKENIIGFGGGTGSMSRATQNTGTPEQMLDYQFKVYGWKTMSDNKTQKVFEDYSVWYKTDNTPSNPNGDWEYVGNLNDTPTTGVTLNKNQYIKYWDYSATDYRFVAGSPISAFTFNPTSGKDDIASAFVEGLGGHVNPNPSGGSNPVIKPYPVYIADPVKITKNSSPTKYGEAVPLTFNRLQTKVRVGIYETIPGYKITNIVFYKQGSATVDTEDANKNNVTLFSATSDYFQGGSDVKATVTYNWDATPNPTYTVVYQDGTSASIKKSENWYGGKFEHGVPAITSNPIGETNDIEYLYGTDNDMFNESGYFIVLPTPTETRASALTLKCDYVLESLDTYKEKITVKGATAAIPAAYCKWEPNKMYTYIFKISQETNGTTGTPGTDDPAGLFPITFDAAAIAETDAKEGYETIINSPSITTYQKGSVTDNGIEYKTGEEIVITVTDDNGSLKTNLQTTTNNSEGYIAVYKLSEEKTEAELVVNRPSGSTKDVTIAGNTAKFTPETVDITGEIGTYGYYAIEYCYKLTPSPVYKYKVIKVIKN